MHISSGTTGYKQKHIHIFVMIPSCITYTYTGIYPTNNEYAKNYNTNVLLPKTCLMGFRSKTLNILKLPYTYTLYILTTFIRSYPILYYSCSEYDRKTNETVKAFIFKYSLYYILRHSSSIFFFFTLIISELSVWMILFLVSFCVLYYPQENALVGYLNRYFIWVLKVVCRHGCCYTKKIIGKGYRLAVGRGYRLKPVEATS